MVYKGIILKPLGPLKSSGNTDISLILTMKPTEFEVISSNSESIVLAFSTSKKSNGNVIKKVLTLQKIFTWTLSVCDKEIDLAAQGIDNKFVLEAENIKVIFDIVKKIDLCCGVDIQNSVISTRLHLIETLTDTLEDISARRIRSIMCLRVVKANSRKQICVMCQKMTLKKKTKEICEKENIQKNDRNVLKQNIPHASNEMIELLISQIVNVEKHPKGRCWSKDIINICLQLYSKSPSGYEMLRNSKMLVLPSTNILILYKSHVHHRPGFHADIFRWMHNEAKRLELPSNGWMGGVIIDEMSIQQDIEILKNGDVIELCGFVDVGEEGNICRTFRMGKKERIIGTHVLQLIFIGTTGFRFPFGHFVTNNVTAYELHTIFWDAVVELSMYGFTTIYTSMDGAQSNRTFMHINLGKDGKTMQAKSPECQDNTVVFAMDISHVLKKIRNNVIKSGIMKTSTRNLTLTDGSVIQWQMWIDAFQWDEKNGLKLHHKLTSEHIYPSSQSKMRNHLAEEVLSKDMLHLMSQYKKVLLMVRY